MGRHGRRPTEFQGKDDLLELLEQLPRIGVGVNGYTQEARAADFIAVFNGTSTPEQGRRVLSQIAIICDPAPRVSDADKPGTLAFKAGMRRVFAEIQLCFVVKAPVEVQRSRHATIQDAEKS